MTLFEKYGREGEIIAGGTELVVQLKTREVPRSKYISDIENISELDYIRDEGETLRGGPVVKHRTLKASTSGRGENLHLSLVLFPSLNLPQLNISKPAMQMRLPVETRVSTFSEGSMSREKEVKSGKFL